MVPIRMSQYIDEQVLNKQDDLWIDIPDDDTEIGQRQDFNDYEFKKSI